MRNIVITADSTFDMLPQMAAELGIEVIASYVRMEGDNIPDYPDVTMEDLFAYHDRSGKLPQTAAASPWDYTEFFKKFEGDEVDIIHIAKSSKMSCCCDNAMIAAQSVKNVIVFDSFTIAGGSAMIAVEAARLRSNGQSAQQIVEALEEYKKNIACGFVVDQLEYLHKGGRCSALAHLGANLLKLRPQIIIKDGAMTVGKKYRGKYDKCLFELIDDMLAEVPGSKEAIVSHTVTDKALLDKAVDYIKTKGGFSRVIVQPAGSAVSCHCGPNTFGIFLLK